MDKWRLLQVMLFVAALSLSYFVVINIMYYKQLNTHL